MLSKSIQGIPPFLISIARSLFAYSELHLASVKRITSRNCDGSHHTVLIRCTPQKWLSNLNSLLVNSRFRPGTDDANVISFFRQAIGKSGTATGGRAIWVGDDPRIVGLNAGVGFSRSSLENMEFKSRSNFDAYSSKNEFRLHATIGS